MLYHDKLRHSYFSNNLLIRFTLQQSLDSKHPILDRLLILISAAVVVYDKYGAIEDDEY